MYKLFKFIPNYIYSVERKLNFLPKYCIQQKNNLQKKEHLFDETKEKRTQMNLKFQIYRKI